MQVCDNCKLGTADHARRERLRVAERRVGAALQQAAQLRPCLLAEAAREEAATQLCVAAQAAERALHSSNALILYDTRS